MELPPGFEYSVIYEPYEPAVVDACERLVQPGFVCADVGANVGVLTLVLARCVGAAGRVISFEPVPENAELLRRNVAHNPNLAERIVVREEAVGDGSSSFVDLHRGDDSDHSGWSVSEAFALRARPEGRAEQPLRVTAIALDECFPAGSQLDLVKIDVEGAEAVVLAGMRHLLADARPLIVLEFHRELGWPAIPVLLGAGYQFEHLDGAALPSPASAADVPYQLVARPL